MRKSDELGRECLFRIIGRHVTERLTRMRVAGKADALQEHYNDIRHILRYAVAVL